MAGEKKALKLKVVEIAGVLYRRRSQTLATGDREDTVYMCLTKVKHR